MADNIIPITTIIENLARENIILVDANLYILPHIDDDLKEQGEKYIDELANILRKPGDSLVVFFVQGNSKNHGNDLIKKLEELLEERKIDITKLNYLWYDLALKEPFSSFKTKIKSEYRLWTIDQKEDFDKESKEFVDHAIEFVNRYLMAPNGLKWRNVGTQKPQYANVLIWHRVDSIPTNGIRLQNNKLSTALQRRSRFTISEWNSLKNGWDNIPGWYDFGSKVLRQKIVFKQKDWDEFGINDIHVDTFVEVVTQNNTIYFQPEKYGFQLSNVNLANALKYKTEFTEYEWDSYEIPDLRTDSFIEVVDQNETNYFQPESLYKILVVSKDNDVLLSKKRIGDQSYESVSNVIISNIRISKMDKKSYKWKRIESPINRSSSPTPRNFVEHESTYEKEDLDNKVNDIVEDLDEQPGPSGSSKSSELLLDESPGLSGSSKSSELLLDGSPGLSGSSKGSEPGPSSVPGRGGVKVGRGGRGRGGRGKEKMKLPETKPLSIKQKFDKIISDLKNGSSINEIEEALKNASVYKDIEEIQVEINDKVTLLSNINKVISYLKKARSKEEINEALEKAYEYENIKEVKIEINNVKALFSLLNLLPSYEPEQSNPDGPSYGSTENLVSKLLQFLKS